MNKKAWAWLAVIAAFTLVVVLRTNSNAGGGSVSPVPAVFDDAHTLDQASAVSDQTGRPVLAFVTADWCGPCQALKRGALSDPEVAAYLREHTVPVYLEERKSADAVAQLAPRVFPTTYLLQNGQTIARIEGGGPPTAYLNTIRRALE